MTLQLKKVSGNKAEITDQKKFEKYNLRKIYKDTEDEKFNKERLKLNEY